MQGCESIISSVKPFEKFYSTLYPVLTIRTAPASYMRISGIASDAHFRDIVTLRILFASKRTLVSLDNS
jgi:hypothetical protein